MFVALTNSYDNVQYDVPNLPWSDGTTVCDIFDENDCQQVNGGQMHVELNNGQAKIYVPKSSEEILAEF